MSGFVKLYGTRLLSSTLWEESPEARLVFIGMLALADKDGIVGVPLRATLARLLNLPIDWIDRALLVLEEPDTESRTPDHEGRRLLRTRTGWIVANHKKYREIRTDKQIADADRQARHRQPNPIATPLVERDMSQASRDKSPEAEAEAEAEFKLLSDSPTCKPKVKARTTMTVAQRGIWEGCPQMGRTRSSQKKLAKAWDEQECEADSMAIVRGLVDWIANGESKFFPGIHTWIADRRWENPPPPRTVTTSQGSSRPSDPYRKVL